MNKCLKGRIESLAAKRIEKRKERGAPSDRIFYFDGSQLLTSLQGDRVPVRGFLSSGGTRRGSLVSAVEGFVDEIPSQAPQLPAPVPKRATVKYRVASLFSRLRETIIRQTESRTVRLGFVLPGQSSEYWETYELQGEVEETGVFVKDRKGKEWDLSELLFPIEVQVAYITYSSSLTVSGPLIEQDPYEYGYTRGRILKTRAEDDYGFEFGVIPIRSDDRILYRINRSSRLIEVRQEREEEPERGAYFHHVFHTQSFSLRNRMEEGISFSFVSYQGQESYGGLFDPGNGFWLNELPDYLKRPAIFVDARVVPNSNTYINSVGSRDYFYVDLEYRYKHIEGMGGADTFLGAGPELYQEFLQAIQAEGMGECEFFSFEATLFVALKKLPNKRLYYYVDLGLDQLVQLTYPDDPASPDWKSPLLPGGSGVSQNPCISLGAESKFTGLVGDKIIKIDPATLLPQPEDTEIEVEVTPFSVIGGSCSNQADFPDKALLKSIETNNSEITFHSATVGS